MTLRPAILALAVALASAAAVAGGPKRHPGPLEKALADAAARECPLLLDFSKPADPPSEWMDREVWSDPALIEFLDANLVVLRLESGGEGTEPLRERFKVATWPTLVFLDSGGEEMERQPGVAGRTHVLSLARDMVDGLCVRSLRDRIDRRPDDGNARALLGKRLFLSGDTAAADIHLRKCLELDPAKARESTKEAAFLSEVREALLGGSAGPLQAFLAKYPDSGVAGQIHEALVQVLSRREEWEATLPSLEILLARSGKPEDRNGLAWSLAKSGRDPARGLALVDEALKEQPTNAAWIDTRAECLSRLGRHDEAVEAQKKAISLLSDSTGRDDRRKFEEHLKEIEKRRDEAKK